MSNITITPKAIDDAADFQELEKCIQDERYRNSLYAYRNQIQNYCQRWLETKGVLDEACILLKGYTRKIKSKALKAKIKKFIKDNLREDENNY